MPSFDDPDHHVRAGHLRRVAAVALAAYEVRPVQIVPLRRSDNAMFRVTTAEGQRYVLRIHRQSGNPWHPVRGAAEVASEMAWLAALRSKPILSCPSRCRIGLELWLLWSRAKARRSRAFACSCAG